MTVTVSFDTPQIQVNNSSTGIQLSQVILPYSIRNSEDFSQYLGGQMTLGQSDGIKLTDNTKDWERLGLAKIKNMVADAEIYVLDPIVEFPARSEAPASSAANSVASSEATVEPSAPASSEEAPVSSASTVASSAEEAPVSSASMVTSSAESQITTTPSESTTEE